MQTGHRQADATDQRAPLVEVGLGVISFQGDWQSCEVDAICTADRPPGLGLEMFPQDWIVVVGQQVCAAIAKAFEGADQIIEIGVMVGVVKLQVGDHTKMGGKFHQGAIRLVCFGHQQAAFTGVAVAARQGTTPPITAVGSSPAAASSVVITVLVVVLPWLPATAIAGCSSIRAASTSDRCSTVSPCSRAAFNSGLCSEWQSSPPPEEPQLRRWSVW